MLSNQRYLDKLPIEILIKLFEFLSMKDVAHLAQTNKVFHEKITGNESKIQEFWKKKYIKHFPHKLNAIDLKTATEEEKQQFDNIHWYNEFVKTYNNEYKTLAPHCKTFFSFAKENDVDGFVKSITALNKKQLLQLLIMKDASGTTIFDCISKQEILDAIWQFSFTKDDNNPTPDYEQVQKFNDSVYANEIGFPKLFVLAAMCNQQDFILGNLDSGLNNLTRLDRPGLVLDQIPMVSYWLVRGGHLTTLENYDARLTQIGMFSVERHKYQDISILTLAIQCKHGDIIRFLIAKDTKITDDELKATDDKEIIKIILESYLDSLKPKFTYPNADKVAEKTYEVGKKILEQNPSFTDQEISIIENDGVLAKSFKAFNITLAKTNEPPSKRQKTN